MRFTAFILLTALVTTTMLGEEAKAWRSGDALTANTSHMTFKDGFGAQLVLTESQQFFEDWKKSETPLLQTLEKNEAHRNVPLFTAILFMDPGIDAAGTAAVTCDFVIRKPDGSLYGEQKDVVGWKGKYLAPIHNFQLTQGHLGIRIEPQDPAGTYSVEVTVRDHIKRVELPLKATFDILP